MINTISDIFDSSSGSEASSSDSEWQWERNRWWVGLWSRVVSYAMLFNADGMAKITVACHNF